MRLGVSSIVDFNIILLFSFDEFFFSDPVLDVNLIVDVHRWESYQLVHSVCLGRVLVDHFDLFHDRLLVLLGSFLQDFSCDFFCQSAWNLVLGLHEIFIDLFLHFVNPFFVFWIFAILTIWNFVLFDNYVKIAKYLVSNLAFDQVHILLRTQNKMLILGFLSLFQEFNSFLELWFLD